MNNNTRGTHILKPCVFDGRGISRENMRFRLVNNSVKVIKFLHTSLGRVNYDVRIQ